MSKTQLKSVIFDLDGVITDTARLHARAWKATFDEYLRLREKRDKEPFREFTHEGDYLPYVDGKPRYKGVQSFLESRDIHIAYGDPADPVDKETVCGLGNKKNDLFNGFLEKDGADVFETSVALIRALKEAGVGIGVASSSKNCKPILESVKLLDLFGARVDGVVSVERKLKGKPEGDIFVAAAADLGTEPAESAVVEDAVSGVQAGRNGGFGLVLGVARARNADALLENGADAVVRDLGDITPAWMAAWFERTPMPLFEAWSAGKRPSVVPGSKAHASGPIVNPCHTRLPQEAFFGRKRLVLFLDYDGTLTPIVARPDLAVLAPQMRASVERLAKVHTVAVVSGRMREDVEHLVGVKDIFYAGSHGLDIKGPGFARIEPRAEEAIGLVGRVIETLSEELKGIEGVLIEKKKISVAVHYRLLKDEKKLPAIASRVREIVRQHPRLRLMNGKKVFEILPNIPWDKGQAVRWIVEALGISWSEASVVYIGDDVTDENAFRALRTRGAGILVAARPQASCAHFQVAAPEDVRRLFEKIIDHRS
ncbi:MAG: trehalose-phosphatase [Deltaproteobacteria bacterium]